jgi:hypothetical protein
MARVGRSRSPACRCPLHPRTLRGRHAIRLRRSRSVGSRSRRRAVGTRLDRWRLASSCVQALVVQMNMTQRMYSWSRTRRRSPRCRIGPVLCPGDLVTVIERKDGRAVHATADVFMRRDRRQRPLNPRRDKDGKPIVELFWAWAGDSRVRALLPSREGLWWCRGHVDGAHLEAAWRLAKSAS